MTLSLAQPEVTRRGSRRGLISAFLARSSFSLPHYIPRRTKERTDGAGNLIFDTAGSTLQHRLHAGCFAESSDDIALAEKSAKGIGTGEPATVIVVKIKEYMPKNAWLQFVRTGTFLHFYYTYFSKEERRHLGKGPPLTTKRFFDGVQLSHGVYYKRDWLLRPVPDIDYTAPFALPAISELTGRIEEGLRAYRKPRRIFTGFSHGVELALFGAYGQETVEGETTLGAVVASGPAAHVLDSMPRVYNRAARLTVYMGTEAVDPFSRVFRRGEKDLKTDIEVTAEKRRIRDVQVSVRDLNHRCYPDLMLEGMKRALVNNVCPV